MEGRNVANSAVGSASTTGCTSAPKVVLVYIATPVANCDFVLNVRGSALLSCLSVSAVHAENATATWVEL
jgi:hypothetical protein